MSRYDFEDVRINLGANLREIRVDRQFTQEELAKKVGIDRTYTGKIERAEENPTLRVVVNLANALDVSLEQLLEG